MDGNEEFGAKIGTYCDICNKVKQHCICSIIIDPYESYFRELRNRLIIGAQCYGDKSFTKTNTRLLQEIQEEILDIAGWSYILWEKLERLKKDM